MSQGSVATRLMCHGVFNDVITNNYRSTLKVKDVELGQQVANLRARAPNRSSVSGIRRMYKHNLIHIQQAAIVTSPAGAVAKYCDKYVCLSVCLCVCLCIREDISGTTRAIFTKFLGMFPMSVARSSSGTLITGRIACRREGGDGSTRTVRAKCNLRLSCLLLDCVGSSAS